MTPEPAVVFELILGKELVRGSFVGKRWVGFAVLGDGYILIAHNARLQVDEPATAAVAVVNSADGAVGKAVAIGLFANGGYVDVNLCAEIGIANADEVTETAELEVGVAFSVRGNDDADAAADQFVNAEVFEMATVGNVEVIAFFIGKTEEFGQEIGKPEGGESFLFPGA